MHPLYCVSFFTSRQTALESSVGISTIPIPVGRTAPCGRIIILQYRSWRNDFSKGRSRITAWVARFPLERSWRTVPVARCITNVSVCFIQLSKSSGESVLLSCLNTVAEQERGGTLNHAPLKSAILFLLVQYQKYQNLKSF